MLCNSAGRVLVASEELPSMGWFDGEDIHVSKLASI